MFRIPALCHVAHRLMLLIRLRWIAARLRTTHGKAPADCDDVELLHQMLVFEGVLEEARPVLQACEVAGLVPAKEGSR